MDIFPQESSSSSSSNTTANTSVADSIFAPIGEITSTTATATTENTTATATMNKEQFTMSIMDASQEKVIESTLEHGNVGQEIHETKVNPVSRYKVEFNNLFCSAIPLQKPPFEILKMNALSGALRVSPLRGLAWKIFLGGLDINRIDHWKSDITKQRNEYQKLLQEHYINPRENSNNVVFDPLSQNDDSPWNKYFQNLEIQKTIDIDLDRTHPDNEFFQDKNIREKMLRILFIYAKTNGTISYRQGMHELLAPIIYLYEKEYSEYKKLDQDPNTMVDFIYDQKFVENDTYTIFYHLMKYTENWYAPGNTSSSTTNSPTTSSSNIPNTSHSSISSTPLISSTTSTSTSSTTATTTTASSTTTSPSLSTSPSQNNLLSTSLDGPSSAARDESKLNEVVLKCKYIHSTLLKQKDQELFHHLESLEIEPQIYLLRWIRLLFGREFHFEDVLNIWDSIFAYGESLLLIDYYCISMLVYIREQLLSSDSIHALKRIFKYPPVEDVSLLIKQAFVIKNSNFCSIASLVKNNPAKENSLLSKEQEKEKGREKESSSPTLKPNNSNNNNNNGKNKIDLFPETSELGLGQFIPFSTHLGSSLSSSKYSSSTSTPLIDPLSGKNSPLPTTPLAKPSSSSLSSSHTTPSTTTTTSTPLSTPIDSTSTTPNMSGININDISQKMPFRATSKHSTLPSKPTTPSIKDLEIQKLKDIQHYLGTSLGEILPIIEKSFKEISNNIVTSNNSDNDDNSSQGEDEKDTTTDDTNIENKKEFLLALAKIKQIKDMLLGELALPDPIPNFNDKNNNNNNNNSNNENKNE
ncbi:hypothetical protein CYY_006506 [Polysphondylium violaceum]|uniref:Rab-GAP TBC domain-containing protein n=1 Tax=Polysphondylium violaceum TaxID=133409 RepID=A0A8J4PS52_9MYCE|nr:hypothetical protein CYY_006506 [Polysphondylium violaceum]